MAKLERAKVLSFDRKLSPSDALMFSGLWDDRDKTECWQSITLREKSVRGTISNELSSKSGNDPAAINKKIENPNPQCVDVATLPFDADTLKITYTLRVLGNLALPSSCTNPEYQALLTKKVNQYIEEHSFSELAKRYAENIANGRFLWRNRVGAEDVEVGVTIDGKEIKFDSHTFDLRKFDNETENLKLLSSVIESGLSGKTDEEFTFITVSAYARLGSGQEVFPSQELIMDKTKGAKNKVLYQVYDTAAIHSQKIGNAIRTIDTWHPKSSEIGPIAIETYGAVTTRGEAYRQPKEKKDFYNLFDNWIIKDKVLEVDEQHYVIATLIRGGVFGKAN